MWYGVQYASSFFACLHNINVLFYCMMSSKFDRQQLIVTEASKYKTVNEKVLYLKTVEEFKKLKQEVMMEKLRRWSRKLNSDHKSEFRSCCYGAKVDNLVARDIKKLLSTILEPQNKKINCAIVNLDILENLLFMHCSRNGMGSVFSKMKHGKGWAVDFCKRHDFRTSLIATVVGSSRSKAHKNTIQPTFELQCRGFSPNGSCGSAEVNENSCRSKRRRLLTTSEEHRLVLNSVVPTNANSANMCEMYWNGDLSKHIIQFEVAHVLLGLKTVCVTR